MQMHKNEGVNRTNYTPANNEKHLVHYKAEIPRHNRVSGVKESHPEILKTGLKMFPTVKRNLEKQGYVIEIIYHPEGKYNTPVSTVKPDKKDLEIEALKAQLTEAEAKLAEQEAQLAEKAEVVKEPADAPQPKKPGRPAKDQKEAPEQGSQQK